MLITALQIQILKVAIINNLNLFLFNFSTFNLMIILSFQCLLKIYITSVLQQI